MASLPECRFCLGNGLLEDAPIYQNPAHFVLKSRGADRAHAVMIIPQRHVADPFAMTAAEWAQMGDALQFARSYLSAANPDGYTIGWNVGAAAGQHVFHAHLHVIARFKDTLGAGRGIHAALGALQRETPQKL
ncbi:HIT family protein [Yoonia sp. BS5-3]|uniref:HIT family protein n=1 Tax=Yoonia phaeophyticola TaxID=3137369 RepID=A0ABZ2V222_9RHOB